MKNSILFLAIILFSCTKEQTIKPDNNLTLTQTFNKPLIEEAIYQSNSISYTLNGNSMQLLFRRTSYNGFSNCCLSNMNGKTVYLAFDMVDATGRLSKITDPNLVPFDNILPPGTDQSWKSCLWGAIKTCARNPLCSGFGPCAREAIVGCIASWSVACLFFVVTPAPVPVIKPIKLNGVSTLPVHNAP